MKYAHKSWNEYNIEWYLYFRRISIIIFLKIESNCETNMTASQHKNNDKSFDRRHWWQPFYRCYQLK